MFTVSPAALGALAFQAALHTPVLCTFASLYSLFRKALLSQTYPTPEIRLVYQHPSHKYFVETSYTELACPLVWGFGHLALHYVKAHQEAKGKQLFQQHQNDTSQTTPLKKAVSYRNREALYAWGIKSRDSGKIEEAASYFEEGLKKGHTGCAVALGQLCLAGLYGVKDTAFERAKTYFQKDNSPFSAYLINLAELMQSCPPARDTLFTMYQSDSNKFGTTFSTAEEIDFTILVANRLSLSNEAKTTFYNCALQHLKSLFQKGQAHYQLYLLNGERTHLEQSVNFEHNRARLDLALILRDEVDFESNQRALKLLLSIPKDKRTTEISTLIGHLYLTGFGTNACNPTAALEHYSDAQPSTGPTDSILYFDALANLLLSCLADERKEFCLAASEMANKTIRWQTTIPSIEAEPGTLDLALAISQGLLAKLLLNGNNMILQTAENQQRITLVQKLLLFSAQHSALPALTRTSAYKQLANLQTLLGKKEEAIISYNDSLVVDDTDLEPLMGLYALYNAKIQHKEAIAVLEKAAKMNHPPAQYLYGLYLRKIFPPDTIKTGLIFKEEEEKENKKSQPGKDLILAAAKAPYTEAVTYCQKKGWKTGIVASSIGRGRSGSTMSTASTTSRATLSINTNVGNLHSNTRPPSYHSGDGTQEVRS